MPSNQFLHRNSTTIGPCKVTTKDIKGWLHLFKMDNVSLRRNIESAEARETVDNVARTMRKAQVDMKVMLTGDIMESNTPEVQRILYGISDTDQMLMPESIIGTADVLNLPEQDAMKLLHPHTIVSTLPPPVDGILALVGTGSSLTLGAWYVWITASYGTGDAHHSTEISTTPATVTVTGTQENLQVDWSVPAGGETPHHYTIWASQTNDVDTALLAATVSGSFTVVLTTDPTGILYTATDTNVFVVKDYATDLVTYVANVDYYYDPNLGSVRRLSAGSIDDGEKVIVEYHYTAQPTVADDIGPGKLQPVEVWLRLHQLADQKDASGNDQETGLVVDLYRVDISSGDEELPFSEGEFMTGISVDWDCLVSRSSLTFGAFRGSSPQFAAWGLANAFGSQVIEGEPGYPPGSGTEGDLGSGGLGGAFA